MKTTNLIRWAAFCFLAMPLLLLAQDAGVPPETTELPGTTSQFWVYGISVVTPFIVRGVNVLIPKVPKWVLPSITPFIGMLLGLGLNKLTSLELTWVDAAQAGAMAVFVREVFNQAVTKQLAAKPAPTAPTPPG